MNSKKTNYIVSILNILVEISTFLFLILAMYVTYFFITGGDVAKYSFNNFIIEKFFINLDIFMLIFYCLVGSINIINAIQNKKSKKLFFWYFIYGCIYVYYAIGISPVQDIYTNNVEVIDTLLFVIIPILMVLFNFIFIKKFKIKLINIIFYIIVIALAILNLFDITLIRSGWLILIIVMQIINIHKQESDIEEDKIRKRINIIIHYIIQSIIVVGYLLLILYTILFTKFNEIILKNEIKNGFTEIFTIESSTIPDLYFAVEKNNKIGFIDENGKEQISCEYDRVSYFNEIIYKDKKYYIALALKDNKYYLITKTNDYILLGDSVNEFLNTELKYLNQNGYKDDEQLNFITKTAKTLEFSKFQFCYTSLLSIGKYDTDYASQLLSNKNRNIEYETINLESDDVKYYYNNDNYSLEIEEIDEEDKKIEDERNDEYYEEDNAMYHLTITKENGETILKDVYLPKFDIETNTIELTSNGSIVFEGQEENGWFDINGDEFLTSKEYTVVDLNNSYYIFNVEEPEYENEYTPYVNNNCYYWIIDQNENTKLKTTIFEEYDDIYLIKNKNNKIVLMNKEFEIISDEYDKIHTSIDMDVYSFASSYIEDKLNQKIFYLEK